VAEIKICSILFKHNNPYGTFVAGDVVDVYWDDTALDIVVKKNDVTITSGDGIPLTFIYAGQPHSYYFEQKIIQVTICNSTSLLPIFKE